MRVRVDLYSDDLEEAREEAESRNVELTVLELVGPAGGNPHVELAGNRFALLELLNLWQYGEGEYEIVDG